MDNNDNVNANMDPTAVAVNATDDSTNQRMQEQIKTINNNSVISGQPNRENLKHDVSNSLGAPLNNNSAQNKNIQDVRNQAQTKNQLNNRTANTASKKRTTTTTNDISKKSAAALALRQKVAKNAMKMGGVPGTAADKILDAQQNNNLLNKRKGLFARLFSGMGMTGARDQVENQTTEIGEASTTAKRIIRLALTVILIPVLSLTLILFISLFVIFSILDNLGLDPEDAMSTSTKIIEDKLDDADDDKDSEAGAENLANKEASLGTIITGNSIYSIKLSKANVLTIGREDFTIDTMNELYPSASEYGNIPYSTAFFYKLYSLNDYYLSLCGKQKLDIPLLVSTLRQESDDMSVVFKSNIGVTGDDEVVDEDYIINKFQEYYKYDYDWSDYEILRHSSLHDMEMLAQHMVKVYSKGYCKYDEEGYKEFLNEFIEKKYYLSRDLEESTLSNRSSKNFVKYDLTEDQLVQIASLCQREQGSVIGAAAEASLMANKFEIDDRGFAGQYSNNGDALYHYVRELGWWANAPVHMDKRNASKEVIEAVKDVLVNGYRTLPKYVNSHDCIDCNPEKRCSDGLKGDICVVKNNNVSVDVKNRSNYISHVSQVFNAYGSTATFYAFPTSTSDPFSYKDKGLREKYGDCHYDIKTGEYVDCVEFKDAFVEWIVGIAEDNTHGYSQAKRDSLIDFDCSSLVYYGLLNSGFNVNQLGKTPFTTRTEQAILKSNGFEEIAVNADGSNLEVGDILWRNGHTEVYIGEGMTVGAHSASNNEKEDYTAGDQNGKEISVVNIQKNSYWTYAYRYIED